MKLSRFLLSLWLGLFLAGGYGLIAPDTVQPTQASIIFDGTNDSLSGTFTSTYGVPLTLACWFKVTTHPAAEDSIISVAETSTVQDHTYRLRTSSSDDNWAAVARTTGDASANIGGVNVDATWASWIGVFTTTTSRDVYLNANTTNETTSRSVNAVDVLRFGEEEGGAEDYAGRVAECAVWDVALSAGDIVLYRTATTAPTFSAGPTLGTPTDTTLPVTWTPSHTGTLKGTACLNGDAGNVTETIAGQCSGGNAAEATLSESTTGGAGDSATFTGLDAATVYDLSFVIQRSNIIPLIDPTNQVGYWAFDTNGVLTNAGVDAGGDLTANGNAAFDSDHPALTPNSAATATIADATTESGCSGAPTITDVDTDEIVTATQTNVVITGTTFCAAQGTGSVTLRQNGNSKTLSVDSWSDTSIQVDMSGVGMGVANGLLYGSMDLRVTNDDAQSDDQAITTNPPSGTQYRTMSGGISTLTFDEFGNRSRPFGDPLDLETTSQVAYRNASGCTLDALDGGADNGGADDGSEDDEDDIYVRVDASLKIGPLCAAADFDFSRNNLYVGTAGTITFVDSPPTMGGIDIDDHVLADGLAITAYDLDDYFFPGDAALNAYAMRQLSNPVDSTTDVNGAVTASTSLVVDDASVLLDHYDGWIRCASGSPVQILGEAVNPLTNTITLRSPITCADNAQVDTYTNGAQSVSGITVGAGTGAVSGTPDTDATTSLLLYRVTDADSLFAEVRLPFEVDVVTIPDTTADDLATGTAALEALGIVVIGDRTCSIAEAIDEILAQTPASFLWGTQVTLEYAVPCTGGGFYDFNQFTPRIH